MFNILNSKQKAALGSVVYECATLESTLNILILSFTNVSGDELEILIGGAMLQKKLDMLKALAKLKLKSKKKLEHLLNIIGKINALNGERVTAVHGEWGPPGNMFQLSWLTTGIPPDVIPEAMLKKHGKPRTVKAERLEEMAADISRCHEHLREFRKAHFIKPLIKRSLRKEAKKANK